jgi:hypothetical protein
LKALVLPGLFLLGPGGYAIKYAVCITGISVIFINICLQTYWLPVVRKSYQTMESQCLDTIPKSQLNVTIAAKK